MGSDERNQLDRVLADLPSLRVSSSHWAEIDDLLARLEAGGDVDAPPDPLVTQLSQVIFEARVQRRFQGTRTGAGVVPTKQTSVLPWVGLFCGGLLVAVGALLGGGVILAGIVGLGLFVFGIAFAGSRVAHRSGEADVPAPEEMPIPIPDAVAARVSAMRRGS